MFKKKLFLLITLIGLVFFQFKLSSQTIQTFNTVGAQSWTCPAGVTSVTVQCWGGGGGGGGGGTVFDAAGGGGGGGAYASSVLAVTPGNTYSIIVGAGGAAGASTGGGGGAGATSTFNSTNVMAVGGNGGGGASTAVAGTAGTGGLSTSGTGTFRYSGGNGAAGTPTLYAGGGGSSAGSSINGNNANADIGGVAPAGGVAGSSYTTIASALIGASGSVGLSGGGGASGGRRGSNSTTNRSGGFGGAGKVVLSYCSTNDGGSTIPTNQTICIGQLPSSLSLSGAVGTTYQWQSSNTGGASWTNISGATASTLNNAQMGTPTATTWYRALVINGSCPAVASNYAVVNVNPNPMFSVNSAAICAGSSAVLTASGGAGGTTYNWSPSSGLNTTNGPSVTSSVLATTQYVVTATLNGCSTNVTTTVTVNANPSITTTQTNVSCTGGNDGIIDLTVTGGIQNNNNIILDVQTVDDNCSTGDIDSWQSFTPTFTARLAAFEVKLDGPDNGNWYLYKGTGVGGVLLASGTYTATAAAGYKYISIPSLPQLTAGQICTFRLTNFSADWLVTCSPNNYSGGQDNNNNADDRVFKTHMILNPYSYLWSNGAVTEDVSNLVAGPYTVTVTDAVGCSAVDTKTITSLGPLAITASASPTTICAGSTSTLTAFGPLTLDQYSIPGSQTGSWAGTNAEQQTFIPSMTGLLRKIRIQTNAPSAGTSVTINIKSGTPTTGTLLTSVTYFKGGPINSWDDIILPGSGINVVSGTTYYIEIVSGSQVDWIYNSTNTYANGNASRGGTNFAWDYNFETYMDLNTYVWNPGALSNPEVAVSPSITTNYTVTVTSSLSCTNSQMVTVNANPVSAGGTASANQSICSGQVPSAITLTGFTGAIQWQSSLNNSTWTTISGATSSVLSSAQIGSLIATTYYRAMVTSGLCTSVTSNVILITVIAYPTVSVNSATICSGSSTVLTASGAANYSWSTGATTSTISVSPASTAIYTVTGTTSGCATTISQTITVNATPTISVNSATICAGATVPLTANGAAAYSWAPGSSLSATTGLSVTSSPSITTIYTISGTTNGCSAINTSTVTVNNNPTVTATSSPTAICVGSSANLTATGASTYTWNPSVLTGSLVSVSPSATTIYTVTGTSAAGCVKTQTINLIVNNNPTVTATTSPTAICVGSSANLTASGASTYTWNPGTLTGTLVSVNPTVTTIYTVTGTSAAGCVSTKTLSLIVNNNPTLTAIPSPTAICVGSSANLTASGASTYTWNPGALTGSLVSVSPTTTTIYTVTGTSAAGCVSTKTLSLIVNNNPTLTAIPSPTAICVGSSANLTASGASTYTWNPGTLTGTLVSVNPTVTTIYTVTGTSAAGCVSTKTLSLLLNANPTVTATTSPTAICVGSSANLTASGASTYTWNLGALTGSLVSVSPTTTTIYTVTGTNAAGCVSTKTLSLIVNNNPTLTAIPSPTAICVGSSANLTASGASTYTWNPGALTGSLVSVSPTTTTIYTVTGTSSAGCVNTLTINLIVNNNPTVTATSSSTALCVGSSANLTATGASTYTWTPGLISGSIITVTPTINTTYTVTGDNGTGCIGSETISIIVNSLPIANAFLPSSDTICYDGAVAVGLNSQAGITSFSWTSSYGVSNNAQFPTFTNVTSVGNVYFYGSVMDFNGCISLYDTVLVVVTPSITLSALTADVSCFGLTDGLIDLSAAGGFAPYSYSWSNSSFTEDLSSLPAGNYSVTVNDASTCTTSLSVIITEPTSLVANSVESSFIGCNGGNGILTVTATGGTGTYIGTGSYTVVAGNYTYTVTDANGCSSTTTINVNEPTQIVATANITSPIACNGGNALLTVSAIGGAGSYAGTGTYTVAAGNYTYTVTDANGCSSTTTISITEPTPIVANVSITSPITCNGGNAIVTATATGGSGPYTGAGTYTVAAGNYTYTVIDANGCSSTTTISVTEPTPIVANVSITSPIICNGGNAFLTVSATGGAGTYIGTGTYTVAAGNYTYTVTDANGCSSTATISVTEPTAIVANVNITAPIACNGGNAILTVSATGGTGLYVGAGTFTVAAGNYTYTVTDANGCSSTTTISITEPTAIVANVNITAPIACNGGNAILTVSATGGTGAYTGAGTFTVAAGNYTYTVTDANGCSNNATITVTQPSPVLLIASATNSIICIGQNTILNGTGAQTYTWSPGLLLGASVTVNPVLNTTYTVTGDNGSGCVGSETISIIVNSLPVVSAGANQTICNSQPVTLTGSGSATSYTWNNGAINGTAFTPTISNSYIVTGTDLNNCSNTDTMDVTVNSILTLTLSASTSSICSGATATLTANGASTYTWNPGLLSGSNPSVNPNSTTTYTVVGDNGTGCVGTETISLIVQQLPNIIANATSTTICVGQSVTLNGAGAANYSWSNGVFDGIAFTPTTTNLYTITGTNAFGCSSTNTIIVNVNNGTSATPNTNPSVICFGDTVQLSVIGGSIPTWSLNSNPSVLTISPMSNISYTYSAIDTLGCVGDITFNVNINQDCDIIVYNGFTPNGDGLNDFWIIDNIEKFPNNKVYVFNRWGNKIFQTTEYNNTNNVWDGKLNGQLVPSGTYFYVIESELLIKKGWIEITN